MEIFGKCPLHLKFDGNATFCQRVVTLFSSRKRKSIFLASDRDWFYDSPLPPSLSTKKSSDFSLTNASWLLDTRKGTTKRPILTRFFLFLLRTIERWRRGGKGKGISGDTAGSLVWKPAIALFKKSWVGVGGGYYYYYYHHHRRATPELFKPPTSENENEGRRMLRWRCTAFFFLDSSIRELKTSPPQTKNSDFLEKNKTAINTWWKTPRWPIGCTRRYPRKQKTRMVKFFFDVILGEEVPSFRKIFGPKVIYPYRRIRLNNYSILYVYIYSLPPPPPAPFWSKSGPHVLQNSGLPSPVIRLTGFTW